MFKKLLDLFKSKEELELTLDELEQWLNTKKSSSEQSLEPVCKELINDLKEYINGLNDALLAFQKAEIKDESKIEQRIVTIVLGNRRSFINQSGFFIKRINPPNYEDIYQIIEFSKDLKREFDSFAKITHKSFYASQHLFFKEVENIKKIITKISKINVNFEKAIKESNINKFEEVKNEIESLKSSIENKFNLNRNLIRLKIKKGEYIKEKQEDCEERIKQIKLSPTYKDHLKDKEDLNILDEKIKKHKLKLEHNFAVIDSALKKYTRIADEEFKLIHGYQEDSFDALLNDKNFEILNVLQKITKKVLENQLVLKDSKKQKILSEINLINRPYLGEIIKKYKELDKERNNLLNKINKNKLISEIREKEEQIKDLNKKIELTEQEINTTNKNINKLDHTEIKNTIEKQFDTVFNIDLKLKLIENDK